jgi:dTDP-4-amino-4,6-dideoxygalactose transaminase
VPLHSSPGGLRYGRANGDMVVTNEVSDRLLRLPMYYEMSDNEMEKVVERVSKYFGE